MKMPITAAVLLLLVTILTASLGGCRENQTGLWPVTDWAVTTPEQQGMNSGMLIEMVNNIQAKKINLHSLVIARNGAIVLEAYFDPYQPEMPHQVASLTKSVIGTLVGIAIKEGKIESVDESVLSFFPDRTVANLDERKQSLTLRHLLTLTDGFQCDFATTEAEMEESADWTQFVLDLPMKSQPGKDWYYCSSSVHLLSAVLSQATGQEARTYANEKLFKPLGIAEVQPEQWANDPQGVTMGSAALILAPRDLAKYALLYTRGGRWNGKQIVPKEWVAESLTQQAYAGNEKEYGDAERGYGYLWSVFPSKGYNSAIGMGGQHIHIVPEKDLVVIFNAATMTNVLLFELLDDYILPAVQADSPLPENAPANELLTATIKEVTYPVQPVGPLPELASRISGDKYQLKENITGWKQVEFQFTAGYDEAQMVIDGTSIPIGLDNIYRVSADKNLGSVAVKGYWKGDDKFMIREIIPGSFGLEFEAAVIFKDTAVVMNLRNTFFGGIVVVHGELIE